MSFNCCTSEREVSNRELLVQLVKQHEKKKAPLPIKLAYALGLKGFLMNQFLFKPPACRYKIKETESGRELTLPKMNHSNLHLCEWKVDVIGDGVESSIPVVSLKKKNSNPPLTIIYSHGNSSDLSDSVHFMLEFLTFFDVEVIQYDYTGYGESRLKGTSEESVCRDLETVLKWTQKPLSQIILWGFSLGTVPTLYTGARHDTGGIILQSPLASLSTFLDQSPDSQIFDTDCLNNLLEISSIEKTPIIIYHSNSDEIIPISHARKLYQCFCKYQEKGSIQLIECEDISHNSMHSYFVEEGGNELQKSLREFLKAAERNVDEMLEMTQIKPSSNHPSSNHSSDVIEHEDLITSSPESRRSFHSHSPYFSQS